MSWATVEFGLTVDEHHDLIDDDTVRDATVAVRALYDATAELLAPRLVNRLRQSHVRALVAAGPDPGGTLLTEAEWAALIDEHHVVDALGDAVLDGAVAGATHFRVKVSPDGLAKTIASAAKGVGGFAGDIAAKLEGWIEQLAAQAAGSTLAAVTVAQATAKKIVELILEAETVGSFAAEGTRLLAEATGQMVKALRHSSPLSPDKADLVVGSEVQAATNGGLFASMESAQQVRQATGAELAQLVEQATAGPGSSEVAAPAALRWVSRRDRLVRDAHAAVDKETVLFGEMFTVGGYSARFPGDPNLPFALRVNCVPAGTRVSGFATALVARHFTGELLDVVLANGQQLSATPDHLVLTRSGWTPMCALQPGDDVLCRPELGSSAGAAGDEADGEPTVEQALSAAEFAVVVEGVTAAIVDLKGNVTYEQVNVVWADDGLAFGRCPEQIEQLGQLMIAEPLGEVRLAGHSSALVRVSHAQDGSLVPGAQGEPQVVQAGHDDAPTDAQFDGYGLHAAVGEVSGLNDRQVSGAALLGGGQWLQTSVEHARRGDVLGDAQRASDACDRLATGEALRDLSNVGSTSFSPASSVGDRMGLGVSGGGLQPGVSHARVHNLPGDPHCPGDGRDRLAAGEAVSDLGNIPLTSFSEVPTAVSWFQFHPVTSVQSRLFSGHVYDLSTSAGLYCSNGIVSHNCRCVLAYVEGTEARRVAGSTRAELRVKAAELSVKGRAQMNKGQLQHAVLKSLCLQGMAGGPDCPDVFDQMNRPALLTAARGEGITGRYAMSREQLVSKLRETLRGGDTALVARGYATNAEFAAARHKATFKRGRAVASEFGVSTVPPPAARRASRQAVFEEFGGLTNGSVPCVHCGLRLNSDPGQGMAVLVPEPIIAWSQGGTLAQSNLVPSCAGCFRHRGGRGLVSSAGEFRDTDGTQARDAAGRWASGLVGGEPINGHQTVKPTVSLSTKAEVKAAFSFDSDKYGINVVSVEKRYKGWLVDMEILDPETNEPIGQSMRQIERDLNGVLEVHHHGLYLDEEFQGKGIGSAYLRDSVKMYAAAGIDHILVGAVSDVGANGAYTWAKLGFRLDKASGAGKTLRQQMIEQVSASISTGWQALADRVGDGTADLPDILAHPLGREFLLGQWGRVVWTGVLPIAKPELALVASAVIITTETIDYDEWEAAELTLDASALTASASEEFAFDPDQPRDSKGRWADTGAVNAARAMREPDTGFTLSVPGLKPVTEGFAVALAGTDRLFLAADSFVNDRPTHSLISTVTDRAIAAATTKVPGAKMAVGGWNNSGPDGDGKMEVNVTAVFPPGAEAAAVAFAVANDQLSIYNIHDDHLIDTGGTGGDRDVLDPDAVTSSAGEFRDTDGTQARDDDGKWASGGGSSLPSPHAGAPHLAAAAWDTMTTTERAAWTAEHHLTVTATNPVGTHTTSTHPDNDKAMQACNDAIDAAGGTVHVPSENTARGFAFQDTLSTPQRKVWENYMGEGYKHLNQCAKHGYNCSHYIQAQVDLLASTFAEHGIDAPKTALLRGKRQGSLADLAYNVGDEYTEDGFGSFSTSAKIAKNFAGSYDYSRIPRSVVTRLVDSHGTQVIPGKNNEGEIIMPRNTRYRVLAIQDFLTGDGDQHRFIDVEVVN